MSTFLTALRSGRVLLMDGTMGTELQRAGLKPGENAATWNVLHPERVRAVHEAYCAAGAEVLLTNTFQANAVALAHLDALGQTSCACDGAQLARSAAGQSKWVLSDIGPIVHPGNNVEFADLRALSLTARLTTMIDWADALLLETCSSPRVRYAIQRIRSDTLLPPVLLSLTYLHDDRGRLVTFSGHAPEWFAERAAHWGLAALGVNCGRDVTVSDCAETIRRYRRVTDLPLFARPNAGTPRKVRNRWVYPLTPQKMAARLPELLEAGVSMVGGCCGTTPQHIAAMRQVIKEWNARHG